MDDTCTVYQTVDFIAKKWTLPILLELYKGTNETRRYSDLKKNLPGITPKTLSQRLKELEDHHLLTKTIDTTAFPIKCHYTLTPSGIDIIRVITDIKTWALKWNITNTTCEHQDCKHCTHQPEHKNTTPRKQPQEPPTRHT